MSGLLKLPIGIENFEKIRSEGFYYADKTKLIEQLLGQWGEVNLFTRPRRFGKSLSMSMLRCFFLKSEQIRRCLMGFILRRIKSYVSNIWENFL